MMKHSMERREVPALEHRTVERSNTAFEGHNISYAVMGTQFQLVNRMVVGEPEDPELNLALDRMEEETVANRKTISSTHTSLFKTRSLSCAVSACVPNLIP